MSQLEYVFHLCSTLLHKEIATLERIKRTTIDLIEEVLNESYKKKFRKLELLSLKDRHLRGHLIEVF